MNLNQLGGIALTAIIVTLGLIKLELIKEVVKKVTTDKEKIDLFSIVLLILISIIPAVIGFTIPNDYSEKQTTKTQHVPNGKTNAEVSLEAVKYGAVVTKELFDEHRDKKKIQDSIFLANRPHKWVYQIGDPMDNNKSILELYKKLNNLQNICLFIDNHKFFFFKNEEHTKQQLDDSLASFQSQIGSSPIISKVDLMTYCNSNAESIIMTKSKTFGKRKHKIEIDCYTIKK